jgi:glycosyltransferase involved in cell wall biosynthesis
VVFIYLGCSGFPFGMAQIERQKLLAKALVISGHQVIIINSYGPHLRDRLNVEKEGNYEGIDYIYVSGTPYKQKGFLKKVYYKLSGYWGEFAYIFNLRRRGKIDAALVTTMDFSAMFYYWILSKLFGFKIILDYVELNSALKNPEKNTISLNYKLFDKLGSKFSDRIICITEFLYNFVKKQNPKAKLLNIPALCDYEKISDFKVEGAEDKYFLFCGSAIYMEVIEFILQSYAKCENQDFYLYLVVNGNPSRMQIFSKLIENHPKADLIKTFSNVSYDKLLSLYKNSRALLIPLRPTLQDLARFPHKIGEYTASSRPVISTSNQELKRYFTDKQNALLAESYMIEAFSEKMKFVVDNPEKADDIGLKGNLVCKDKFNYKVYGNQIVSMIEQS